MIRLVSEFVERPTLLVLCDNPSCGVCATIGIDQTKPLEHAIMEGLQVIVSMHGFAITFMSHFCGRHVEKARQDQKLVKPASSLDIKNITPAGRA